MELALAALAALSIALILIAVILNHQVAQAQSLLDEARDIRLAQAREIERLGKQAHALELQLQLKNRPPRSAKKQALDPFAAKLKIISYLNEVLKDG